MQYSIFVLSLKRLFNNGRINAVKLDLLLNDSKITTEEYEFITGEAE
jgi:hypothetical protein